MTKYDCLDLLRSCIDEFDKECFAVSAKVHLAKIYRGKLKHLLSLYL